jgi:hypothetical protein
MGLCSIPDEPPSPPWFKRTASYMIESLRIAPPRSSFEIVSDDEYDEVPYIRVTYEIEQLRNCEPEIIDITVEEFKGKEWKVCKVSKAIEQEIIDYLYDDHSRWTAMKDWLEEEGNAEYHFGVMAA